MLIFIKKFIHNFLFIFLIFVTSNFNALGNIAKSEITSQDLIYWNESEAIKHFESAKFKNDFYQLVNFYQPQINPLYCAVASSVIVLNALKYGEIPNQEKLAITLPQSRGGKVIPYNEYSQLTFLNEETDKIKKHEIIEFKQSYKNGNNQEIFDEGLNLSQLQKILEQVYKVKAKIIFATKSNQNSIENFRNNLKKYLNDKDNFILVNFDGRSFGAKVAGHISPIVAYDENSDLVLVMDVALHKQLWYFISLTKLYEAMNTKDKEQYRGYMIISLK